VISQGTVKYSINKSGDLMVIPKYATDGTEISHAVITRGQPVIAAGEADIAGSVAGGYFGIEINPHSGHFMNSNTAVQNSTVIQAAKNAFAKFGIIF
jgi:hypothetical protein